jgi:hypothetical protein
LVKLVELHEERQPEARVGLLQVLVSVSSMEQQLEL